ncbi:MAG: hypothetical protein FWE36_06015 [Erysipelotrichales bacterium]|nr:hypothetical protein [Erysipelotrichales bacterium]
MTLPSRIISFENIENNKFAGITFDGQFFYLTQKNSKKICKFNSDFKSIDAISTCQNYTKICFDKTIKCFWAKAENDKKFIYRLCSDFKATDKMLIAHNEDNLTSCKSKLIQESFGPNIIKNYDIKIFEQIITITALHDGQKLLFKVPNDHIPLDISLLPVKNNSEIKFALLVSTTCGDSKILIYNNCFKQNKICGKDNKDNDRKPECCDFVKTLNCRDAVVQVVQSVAFVETALAYLIQAESEKIKKAIEIASTVEELLDINSSIQKTIVNVLMVEQVLYQKLDAANELYKKCKD